MSNPLGINSDWEDDIGGRYHLEHFETQAITMINHPQVDLTFFSLKDDW